MSDLCRYCGYEFCAVDDVRLRCNSAKAVADLTAEVERLRADLSGSLCVECGPDVNVDEDGCCTMCGGTALGTWLFRKHAELATVGRTKGMP